MRTEFDVVIVGGSFAGLHLASILPPHLSVCVIERSKKIGDTMLSTASTFILPGEDLFTKFKVSERCIIAKYNGFRISTNEEAIDARFPHHIWVLTDPLKLKQELAKKCHATFMLGWSATKLHAADDDYTFLDVSDGEKTYSIKAKVFVDATGSSQVLCHQAKLRKPHHLSEAYQVDAKISSPVDNTMVEMCISHKQWQGGYAYIFPITPTKVRIGVCIINDYGKNKTTAKEAFERFVTSRRLTLSNITHTLDRTVYSGGNIGRNHHRNLIAIGDSASHISPVIGEGIRFAFHSGSIAAPLIVEYMSGDKHAFDRYKTRWQALVQNRFASGYLFQNFLGRIDDRVLSRIIRNLRKRKGINYRLLRIVSTQFTTTDLAAIGGALIA